MDLKLYAAWRPARRNPGVQVTSRRAALAVALLTLISTRAEAETKIEFWHAMSGELGQHLERLVADFNRSQPDDRIVPVYRGNYTEVVSAAIFAVRTHTQPAIVQVPEVATATMMAAR
ncbi:MAG TPA: hypothetical protein VKC66_23025, partial [Xanthobacteraceae bacterium]|nr:hypothetical protein [Xanthobacteraceae bacterium]